MTWGQWNYSWRIIAKILFDFNSPKSYLILELATNILEIFKENWMKITKSILEEYKIRQILDEVYLL